MIQVFYNQLNMSSPDEKWSSYLQQMPEDIKERIRRYRKKENKYQLLIGRLLLREGMHQLGFYNFDLQDLHYNEHNCPLWITEIHFNIAHSQNIVACAFSKTAAIGLDVERIRKINLNDFEYILNDLDHQNIKKSQKVYQAFFKIWTIKEAITKAIGKGLAIDVQQIYIFDEFAELEGQKWYYQSLNLAEGFAAHIVSDKVFSQLEIKELQF